MKSEEHSEEIEHALDLLKRVVKSLGPTRQQLERQIGMSSGWASKVLNGEIELRVRHILTVLEVCGVEPWRFFAAAFPQPGVEERSVAALFQIRADARRGTPADFASELSQALRRVVDLLESGADINAALQRRADEGTDEGSEELEALPTAQTS
jgi:transcriptional regulator with XRE-family HTH domain